MSTLKILGIQPRNLGTLGLNPQRTVGVQVQAAGIPNMQQLQVGHVVPQHLTNLFGYGNPLNLTGGLPQGLQHSGGPAMPIPNTAFKKLPYLQRQ